MNFITIDFETATGDGFSPCEVGLTFVENWEIKETKSWLIKPKCYPYFNPINISIHGIIYAVCKFQKKFGLGYLNMV
jgi:DNA polymerase-3 subunit epsilon